MLLTQAVALPLLTKTEPHFSRYQEDAINGNLEYKLARMMAIPDGCHKEVREGLFDIQSSGFINKKLTLVPRNLETGDSYLLLQVINNRVFGLDMYKQKVIIPEGIKYITSGHQPKFSSDHFAKNGKLGTNFLFRLEQFNEESPNLLFWFTYCTDLFVHSNKTSVIIELEPFWFTSHAFSSKGERCCQFRKNIYFLDPEAFFTKSCTDVEVALEYAKVNPYPMVKGDALEVIKKPNGKFI
jgi:hypothetical protein